MGCDSAVGTETRYRLNDPGIETGTCEIFRTIQTGPEPYPTDKAVGV